MSLPTSRSLAGSRARGSALRSSQLSFTRSSGRKSNGRLADRFQATVEIEAVEDFREIAELCEFARSYRFLITCNRCRDPHAPLTAVVWPRRKPNAVLAFCKRCYGGFSAMAVDMSCRRAAQQCVARVAEVPSDSGEALNRAIDKRQSNLLVVLLQQKMFVALIVAMSNAGRC